MRKLTCSDLLGPCDAEVVGQSFEEIGKKSHAHGQFEGLGADLDFVRSATGMKTALPGSLGWGQAVAAIGLATSVTLRVGPAEHNQQRVV